MRFPKYMKIGGVFMDNIFTWNGSVHKTKAGAFEGELLMFLSETLGFKYEVILEPKGQWGTADEFEKGTGLIGMVQRGEVDMGISYLSITERRDMAVDFSYPYAVLERTFTTEPPEYMDKFVAFTFPFSRGVWIACFCTILAAAFLFKQIIFKKSSYLSMLILTLGSMMSQSVKVPGKSLRKRFLYGSWLVYVTIIPFIYSALLLSFLTLPMRQKGVKTFQELSNAVQSGRLKCFAPIGTVDLELILSSNIDYLRTLGQYIQRNRWEFYQGTKEMEDILNASTAIVGARQLMVMRVGYGPFLNKFVSDDFFGTWHVGVAVKKTFCCKDRLDTVIHRMLSSGIYKKWFEHEAFVTNMKKHTIQVEKPPVAPLSLEDLKGVFSLLLVGYVAAFAVFLVEILSKNRCRSKNVSKLSKMK